MVMYRKRGRGDEGSLGGDSCEGEECQWAREPGNGQRMNRGLRNRVAEGRSVMGAAPGLSCVRRGDLRVRERGEVEPFSESCGEMGTDSVSLWYVPRLRFVMILRGQSVPMSAGGVSMVVVDRAVSWLVDYWVQGSRW